MRTVYYLTGPVQSQKTTRLASWCHGRTDVAGLLSPVVFDKRHFLNVRTKALVPMEAELTETKVQQVGRYTFSSAAFNWANEILVSAVSHPGIKYLLIDEIGPLELQGNGLNPALEVILEDIPLHLKVVLVIREKILESALVLYCLHKYTVKPFDFPE